jgi:hypothetical protein
MPFDGGPGTMAPMAKPAETDPDVERALRVAQVLESLAEQLGQPLAERIAEIDPDRFDPEEHARLVEADARETIRRIHDAWQGLDAINVAERAAKQRETLLQLCRMMGRFLRAKLRQPGAPPSLDQGLADLAVRSYARDVPEHADLARHNIEHVRALIQAIAQNVGGRAKRAAKSVEQCVEELCDAMGYPADYKTVGRTAGARRARSRAKPPR